MPEVEVMSFEEATERRAELLRSLPMSEGEFRDRAAKYQLTAEEMAVAEELRALDFLISD
jgi:hypothetical protein